MEYYKKQVACKNFKKYTTLSRMRHGYDIFFNGNHRGENEKNSTNAVLIKKWQPGRIHAIYSSCMVNVDGNTRTSALAK